MNAHLDPIGLERVLVRAPNWVGDAVMALPLLAALRQTLPEARIEVLGVPWVEGLFRLVPGVDGFVAYDRRGVHRGATGTLRLARELESRGYDAALLVPRSLSSALAPRLARIPVRAGFASQGRSRMLTHAVPFGGKHQPGVHDTTLYVGLARALGLEVTDETPRLELPRELAERAAEIAAASGLADGRYAVLAPGAAFGGAKRYPAERFAALADAFEAEHGLETVLLGSPGERPIALELMRRTKQPAVDLVGRIALEESLAVLAGARVAVTNDSGLMHAAAALGVPLVTPFGPTDPRKTGPLGPHARVVTEPVPCAPCFLRECPIDQRCMTGIPAERVLAAAREVLRA